MSTGGAAEGLDEKIMMKRDSTVTKSVRPLVCSAAVASKGKRKSSNTGVTTVTNAEDIAVGAVFEDSFTVYRTSELIQTETEVNTTLNIQPSYRPISQQQGLRVSSMPFGCYTPVESVQRHALGGDHAGDGGNGRNNDRRRSSSEASVPPAEEKSSKKKKRNRESLVAADPDPAAGAAPASPAARERETPRKAKKAKR